MERLKNGKEVTGKNLLELIEEEGRGNELLPSYRRRLEKNNERDIHFFVDIMEALDLRYISPEEEEFMRLLDEFHTIRSRIKFLVDLGEGSIHDWEMVSNTFTTETEVKAHKTEEKELRVQADELAKRLEKTAWWKSGCGGRSAFKSVWDDM